MRTTKLPGGALKFFFVTDLSWCGRISLPVIACIWASDEVASVLPFSFSQSRYLQSDQKFSQGWWFIVSSICNQREAMKGPLIILYWLIPGMCIGVFVKYRTCLCDSDSYSYSHNYSYSCKYNYKHIFGGSYAGRSEFDACLISRSAGQQTRYCCCFGCGAVITCGVGATDNWYAVLFKGWAELYINGRCWQYDVLNQPIGHEFTAARCWTLYPLLMESSLEHLLFWILALR